MDSPADDQDMRRRRLLYRAMHRGSKEMDWLLGRVVAARLATFTEPALPLWEALLAEPDPALQDWIMGAADAPAPYAPLVAEIRAFHGLV